MSVPTQTLVKAVQSAQAAAAVIKPVVDQIAKLAPVTSQVLAITRDVKSFSIDQLPQDIAATRAATTQYLAQKMPSTDSWLYKNTNFVDNPTVQKIANVDQKVLNQIGQIAPVATSAGLLARDIASGQIDKVPQDIKQTQAAMTDYFTQKMPSTNSALYKATNFVDNSKVQAFIKADQKVLDQIGQIAPVTTSAGTLARDIASGQIDKVPQDIKQTQAAMTDYFTQKMSSTNSWLYQHTGALDNPVMQQAVKLDQRVLDTIEKF